ncbi:MAG: sigma-70 family RNA polymerase sigma factor [Candidatus Liptonbacteria bacterium]|nr:sigma-70 family RNA polymerase sigma factor [Candidatus Liptonbacteria bacterium]
MLDGENNLTKRAIGGEASAFGLLYNHYQPKIYRFIYFKVGHREEAEDLTHQVFMKAWTNIREYKSRGFPFGSWLYRIARNQVIDHYRTKKDEGPIETVQNVVLASTSDLRDLDSKLSIEKIRATILKLKPEYQEVIIMKFVEDLTTKEIASALEKSEGAVKLLQHRAIKGLKEMLNN